MENPFKNTTNPERLASLVKPKKAEKSQTELRNALKERFSSMEKTIKQEINEYKNSLKNETFLDKDGEEEGSGEKRKEAMQEKINTLLERAEQMKGKLESKNELPSLTESISTTYKKPDGQTENITFSLEEKFEESVVIYKKTKLDLPPDFEDQMREIWGNNIDAIQKAIEEGGFDDVLLMPGSMPLPDLHTKMTEGYTATYQGDNFKQGGSFAGAKSANVDKPRIVLVNKTQNLKDSPELKKTLNVKGQDLKRDQILTLEDYLVFQRKYFEETGNHLDADGWTWLATESGSRLVNANWNPSDKQVNVNANDLDYQNDNLGARPSRCSRRFHCIFLAYFIQPWVILPVSWSFSSSSR